MNRSILLSQNGLFQVLPFLILTVLAGYFLYHLITGERSIMTFLTLDKKIIAAQALHDDLQERRLEVEGRVVRLRPASLDLDYLEERAQFMLGLGQANDIAIRK